MFSKYPETRCNTTAAGKELPQCVELAVIPWCLALVFDVLERKYNC